MNYALRLLCYCLLGTFLYQRRLPLVLAEEFFSERRDAISHSATISRLPLGTTSGSAFRIVGNEVIPRGGSDDIISMSKYLASDDGTWIGGGAVNEKQREHIHENKNAIVDGSDNGDEMLPSSQGFQPARYRSHLCHALEGLDRYPNYLQRWSTHDVDLLESSLEEQLSKVRQQRTLVSDMRTATQNWVREFLDAASDAEKSNYSNLWITSQPTDWDDLEHILDERALAVIRGSTMFATAKRRGNALSLAAVLNGTVDFALDVATLTQLMDEECHDVYSFPLLSTSFVDRLRDYVKALNTLAATKDGSQLQQLARRPLDLDAIGLCWLNDMLLHLIMRPMARHLFQSTEHLAELDWRHGFIAGYSATPHAGTPRERLVSHTDDSEVTLNVGLGNVFEGGEVIFHGLRGSGEEREVFGSIPPRPGVALLHIGRQLHAVAQVTTGDRYAIIVWVRSWQGVRAQSCACCWLNRRQDQSCICGLNWN